MAEHTHRASDLTLAPVAPSHGALFLRACRASASSARRSGSCGRPAGICRIPRAQGASRFPDVVPDAGAGLRDHAATGASPGVDAAILFPTSSCRCRAWASTSRSIPARTSHGPSASEADVSAAARARPARIDGLRARRGEPGSARARRTMPLIGFAGAPFTVATYLVEGGGSKSFSAIKRLLFAAPALAHDCSASRRDSRRVSRGAGRRPGADAAMLFDTWAGLLSPADFDTFALPYVRRVLEASQAAAARAGRVVPRIYYAGDAAGWLDRCPRLGADVIGLDWRLDLDRARRSSAGPDAPGQSRSGRAARDARS